MKIEIQNNQKTMPIFSREVKKIVQAVIALEGTSCDEVAIHFVTSDEISRLHQVYFNDPSPTDCISFPLHGSDVDIGYHLLGEIFVCPETALSYAQKHGYDPFEECTLYIVHALLHLIGYEDTTPRVKAVMRRAEKKHMNHLKKCHLVLRSKGSTLKTKEE